MDTNTVGSIPQSPPLAAQIGDVNKLYDLARDKSASARKQLAEDIGSILEIEVSARESELVADLLTDLMRQSEKEVRLALSEKLSTLSDVPLRLVLEIANDEIEIAEPVLKSSPVLAELDLMYIIKSKPASYWQAIAARGSLTDQVINTLAETKDFDTALILVENEGIILTNTALVFLSDMAQDSDELAQPLLMRNEVSAGIAKKLYAYVGAEIRANIAQNYDLDPSLINQAVDDVVADLSSQQSNDAFVPDEHVVFTANTAKMQGILNTQMMLTTLRSNNLTSFIAQLHVYTSIPFDVLKHVLSQSHGQGLAMIAKAYGFKKADFISIFMLTAYIWNSGDNVDLKDIKAASLYFERATQEIAKKIVREKMNGKIRD